MSLSTITVQDAPTKYKKFTQRPVTSLNTEDIEGSKPRLKGYQYINKPEFSMNSKDIEKSGPRPLHPSLNRPEFNLKTSDIASTNHQPGKFKSTRVTNPLNPAYNLPSFELRPVTPPKFVRDSINIQDISGAKPEKYFKWQTRDIIGVSDIEGAKPKPERTLVKPDLMDPRDINGEEFHSKRITNPLEPSYVHRDSEGNLTSIGLVPGSKSKPALKAAWNPHRRNLDNQDIEGSAPGTVGLGVFANKQRNYSKKLVDNNDIEGCKPGSHNKGIVTKRTTNPLNPVYEWRVEDEVKEITKNGNGKEKTEDKPKVSENNNAAFWGTGANPSVSGVVVKARPNTCLPYAKPNSSASYKRNVHKFFEVSVDSQNAQDHVKRNTENFFDNPQKRLEDKFLAAQNPSSIHRRKKEQVSVGEQGLDKNINGFFGGSVGSLSRPSSNGSYQFKLSRKEISRPEGF